jgi:hypothetical protein
VSEYQFQPALDKQKATGFASLTTTEKWEWHADVYGFRRVCLGIHAEQKTSPCDQSGKWFEPARANVAEAHYRELFGRKREQAPYPIHRSAAE